MINHLETSNIQQQNFGLPSAPGVQKPLLLGDLLWADQPLKPEHFNEIRRRAMLDGFKWDSQVGDLTALSDFPYVIKQSIWRQLAEAAERLAAEAMAAEREIVMRPELLRMLGLPAALLEVFLANEPLTPEAGRVVRFDFHLTTNGWRISEANSDVPGGFTEGSYFTKSLAHFYPHLRLAGDPAEAWCDALAVSAGSGGQVALLSATPILEDHQVNMFIASRLAARGCVTHLAKPEQICWRDGVAHLNANWYRGPLNAVVRFYQAEWLPKLPTKSGWRQFLRGGKTPVANPALAVITESKRFPLTWDRLKTPLPTWRALLPASNDPRELPWFNGHDWLLKTAFCNNGESVSISQLMKPGHWWKAKLRARCNPNNWIAQKRFESVPLPTPHGPRHVCVGVYTVNGRAAGVYARMSDKPLMDYTAVDVALLIDDNE